MNLITLWRTPFVGTVFLFVLLASCSALEPGSCSSFGYACINETHFDMCIETFANQLDPSGGAFACPPATRCVDDTPFICGDIIPEPSAGQNEPRENYQVVSEQASNKIDTSKASPFEISKASHVEISETELPSNQFGTSSEGLPKNLNKSSAVVSQANIAEEASQISTINENESQVVITSANLADDTVTIVSKNLSEISGTVLATPNDENPQSLQKNISEPEIKKPNLTDLIKNFHNNSAKPVNQTQKLFFDIHNVHSNGSQSRNFTSEVAGLLQNFHKNILPSVNLTQKGEDTYKNVEKDISGSENETQNWSNFLQGLSKNVSHSTNMSYSLADLLQKFLSENQTRTITDPLEKFHINMSGSEDEKNARSESEKSFQNPGERTLENTVSNSNPKELKDNLQRDASITINTKEFPVLNLDEYLPADFPDLIKNSEGNLPAPEKLPPLPKIAPQDSKKASQNVPSLKLPNSLQVPKLNDIPSSQKNSEFIEKQPLSSSHPSSIPEENSDLIHLDIQDSNIPSASKSTNALNIKPSGRSTGLSLDELLSDIERDLKTWETTEEIYHTPTLDIGMFDSTETTEFTTLIVPENPSTNAPDFPDEFVCAKSGKFPAPPSCTKFHVCTRIGRFFRHQVRSCWRGLEFNPRWRKCVPWFLSGCSKTEVENIPLLWAREENLESERKREKEGRRGWYDSRESDESDKSKESRESEESEESNESNSSE